MSTNTENTYRRRNPLAGFSGILLSNTVLERGLVIAPVIITGNNLRNAVGLGLAFSIITFLTIFITYFLPKTISHVFRAIINTMIAAGLFIPTAMLLNLLLPGFISSVGIFLPLLITNSLIVQKSGTRFYTQRLPEMTLDLFNHMAGFTLVICFVGFIRELAGNASIWDIPIKAFPKAPAILLPFSGFIIVGFLAAAIQKLKLYLIKRKGREVSSVE